MQEFSEHIHSLLLPVNFVSLPSNEDGFVSLHQQTDFSEDDGSAPITSERWRSKAIRRKLSKLKELVLYVGGLPKGLDKNDYVKRLSMLCNKRDDICIGPIFPDQGCTFVSFTSGMTASSTAKLLHERRVFGVSADMMFLPYIAVPAGSPVLDPLLVFINSKSGGGQGRQLTSMMRGVLNRSQIFQLDLGGPMPGLYAFRKLPKFRILVCGGDGTAGWVLSCLELMHRHLQCRSPPVAVLPLGTGNDLARVMGFGSGWSGEGVANILYQVQEAKPVIMDRWTILFDSSPAVSEKPRIADINNADDCNHEDEAGSLTNGHKKVQRTHKYFPHREKINIVMGVGEEQMWRTADQFKSQDEESSPEDNVPASTQPQDSKKSDFRASANLTVEKDAESLNSSIESNNTPNEYDSGFSQTESNAVAGEEPVKSETVNSELFPTVPSTGRSDLSDTNNCESKPPAGQLLLSADDSATGTHASAGDISNHADLKSFQDDDADSQTSLTPSELTKRNTMQRQELRRKSVHRKLQIFSSSDILEPDRGLTGPSIKNWPGQDSDDEPDDIQPSMESIVSYPDDVTLKPDSVDSVVDEILQSELPDIMNDKHKLITLLTSDNAHSELGKMIRESKENAAPPEEGGDKDTDGPAIVKTTSTECFFGESNGVSHVAKPKLVPPTPDEEYRYLGPRKKMSLPLIHTHRSIRPDDACLQDIVEEDSGKKVTKHASALQRSLSEIADDSGNPESAQNARSAPRIISMNNYFGIGIDAECSLYFHMAREEHPEKFSSRLHNKAVYFKAAVKKMTSRSVQLNTILELEVDDVKIPLPSIKGLIFLNISSWGAGGNAWGTSTSRRFQCPAFGDGALEVVGIGGIAHMSQIYGGIRSGLRIAQGQFIKLHISSEVAVQVDGEPWMQPPGQIIITLSTLQAMMLKRQKKKTK